MKHARACGQRFAGDFIRHYPPTAIMEVLSDQPQARAQLLVLTTGMRREIALKKSVALAAEDLQMALDEGVTDAEAVVRHFVGLTPARTTGTLRC